MQDLQEIQRDRLRLQERWFREGYHHHRSLSDAIIESGKKYSDVENIFYIGETTVKKTLGELYEEGLKFASALKILGIAPGDIIAVQLPTRHETAVIYQAIAHVGAVVLPIIHSYGEQDVINVIEQSGATMLITQDRWRKIDYIPRFTNYNKLEKLQHLVVLGESVPDYAISWENLLKKSADGFTPSKTDANAVSTLIYTSGTTSSPKGVQHSANTLLVEMASPAYVSHGLYLCCLPAGHFAGYSFLMRSLLMGVASIFVDHWEADLAARIIEKHRIVQSGGTPFFLFDLVDAAKKGNHDLSSLTSFNMGGSSITPAQIEMTDKYGFPGGRIYGSTEHPTITSCTPAMSFSKRATTDGKVDVGVEVRIIDNNGENVALGEEGEIISRGPELFLGYTDDNLNKECFLPGGWYKTGDVGKLDKDSYITITDRIKDIIIRGGENIASKEIEDVLTIHPLIDEAAAVAIPDEKYGEKVAAFLLLADDKAVINLEDIASHFADQGMARFKTPEYVETVTSFPRTPSGKVKKHELREKLSSAYCD